MDAPFYLKKYTKKIDNLPGFKYQNWLDDLSWKGQLCMENNYLFSIYFEGVLCKDDSIVNEEGAPLRVYAKDSLCSKKIVLFDEELYGYTPLLIEKKVFPKNGEEKLYEQENCLFEVFLWTNSSVDFEDEFSVDKNNKIMILNGNRVDVHYLKSNAFDAFGIILKNQEGRYINLLEIELS